MGEVGLLEFGSELQLESIALRDLVLRKPLGLVFTSEDLQSEKDQYHIAYCENGQVLGILLLKELESSMKMRQVAVHPDHQSEGIGRKLVKFSEEFAVAMGKNVMELHARDVAIEFYLNQGYKVTSETFEEVGIPHKKMEKNL